MASICIQCSDMIQSSVHNTLMKYICFKLLYIQATGLDPIHVQERNTASYILRLTLSQLAPYQLNYTIMAKLILGSILMLMYSSDDINIHIG